MSEDITKKPAIEQVDFQFSNVKGWLSVNNYECALIKAECLKDAVDKLIEELKQKVSKGGERP
jgi:hypothetical protein